MFNQVPWGGAQRPSSEQLEVVWSTLVCTEGGRMWPPPGTCLLIVPNPCLPVPHPAVPSSGHPAPWPARGLEVQPLGPLHPSLVVMGVLALSQPAACRAWPPARRRQGSLRQPLYLDNSAQTRQGNPRGLPTWGSWSSLIPFSSGLPSVFIFVQSHLHKQGALSASPSFWGEASPRWLFGRPPTPRDGTLGSLGTPSCRGSRPLLLPSSIPVHSTLSSRQPPGFCLPLTYPQPPGITGKAITSGLSCSLILIKDSGHRVFA